MLVRSTEVKSSNILQITLYRIWSKNDMFLVTRMNGYCYCRNSCKLAGKHPCTPFVSCIVNGALVYATPQKWQNIFIVLENSNIKAYYHTKYSLHKTCGSYYETAMSRRMIVLCALIEITRRLVTEWRIFVKKRIVMKVLRCRPINMAARPRVSLRSVSIHLIRNYFHSRTVDVQEESNRSTSSRWNLVSAPNYISCINRFRSI